jgi:hypothetical protein
MGTLEVHECPLFECSCFRYELGYFLYWVVTRYFNLLQYLCFSDGTVNRTLCVTAFHGNCEVKMDGRVSPTFILNTYFYVNISLTSSLNSHAIESYEFIF